MVSGVAEIKLIQISLDDAVAGDCDRSHRECVGLVIGESIIGCRSRTGAIVKAENIVGSPSNQCGESITLKNGGIGHQARGQCPYERLSTCAGPEVGIPTIGHQGVRSCTTDQGDIGALGNKRGLHTCGRIGPNEVFGTCGKERILSRTTDQSAACPLSDKG